MGSPSAPALNRAALESSGDRMAALERLLSASRLVQMKAAAPGRKLYAIRVGSVTES